MASLSSACGTLPPLPDLSKQVPDLFKVYQKEHQIHANLLEGNKATVFVKLCIQQKTCGDVARLILGQSPECDFGRVLLWAKDANVILLHFQKDGAYAENYRFVHAICPVVVDRWNLVPESVIDCYYRDLGSLTKCPSTVKAIHKLWQRIGCNYEFVVEQTSDVALNECTVCRDTVFTRNEFCLCLNCNSVYHFDCANTWFGRKKGSAEWHCCTCQVPIEKRDLHEHPVFPVFNLRQQYALNFDQSFKKVAIVFK